MHFLYLLLLICNTCNSHARRLPPPEIISNKIPGINPYGSIADIPLPPGYKRLTADSGSFAAWLRRLPLRKDKTVYTYNGLPKANQAAQFAVIDISTGNKDLQQCADAVIRLRAEYLFQRKKFTAIDFTDNHHTHYRLSPTANRAAFDNYLAKVFSYCGTASLEQQLLAVKDFTQIQAGDVLIKGGCPGHAMQVVDIANNKSGKKIYLLAQSYMPAQDMHVVINPLSNNFSPWYEATEQAIIRTPEWVFSCQQLRKWPSD